MITAVIQLDTTLAVMKLSLKNYQSAFSYVLDRHYAMLYQPRAFITHHAL